MYLRLYLESSKVLGNIIVYLYRFGNIHMQKLDKNNANDIVNPWLGNEVDHTEIEQLTTTASMCIHHFTKMRADMNRVCYLNQTLSQNPIFVYLF